MAAGWSVSSGFLFDNATEVELLRSEGFLYVVETSSRGDYAGTRHFYEVRGYRAEASLQDFYAPDDHRVIYTKRFAAPEVPSPTR